MTRKVLLALAFVSLALCAVNSLADCVTGPGNVIAQFVGAGSSAQFNSFAYAAYKGLGLQGNTGDGTGFWTSSSPQLQDTRVTPNAVIDSASAVFVAWDTNANGDCDVYVYYSIDSGIGTKDFFAYLKQTATPDRVYGAVFGYDSTGTGTGWEAQAGANAIPGITDSYNGTGSPTLPPNVQTWLVSSPAPSSTSSTPQPDCGQVGALGGSTAFCYFSAGMTDIRPEDALYATTRALSSFSTTNGLAGLGYDQAGCNAPTANQGCAIFDAFGQGKVFNVMNFKLSGTDPFPGGGAVPVYTTLATGATPVIVFVGNEDTSTSLSFGSTTGGAYNFTNINRGDLTHVFTGATWCTGDLVTSSLGSSGKPIQVIIREPLSGTYNTFEFGAIRTATGSGSTLYKESSTSHTTWISNLDSGQELDVYGNLPSGPATSFQAAPGAGACGYGKGSGGVNGSQPCGDPLFNPDPAYKCNLSTFGNANAAWKARAIGTGEEVKSVDGGYSGTGVAPGAGFNPIGYAFWSYQNFSGACGSPASAASGDVSCGTYKSHYLTVDGVDGLFSTPGGAGYGGTVENPSGQANNFPQCSAIQNGVAAQFPCQQLPFTHIKDGSYPIWSLLRLATFANKAQSTASNANPAVLVQATPAGVINMVAAAETEAVDPNYQFSDLVPLFTGVTNASASGTYLQGIAAVTTSSSVAGVTTVTWAGGANNPSVPFDARWCGGTLGTFPQACSAGTYININGDYCPMVSIQGATTTLKVETSCTNDVGAIVSLAKYTSPVIAVWNQGTDWTGNVNLGVFHSHYVQSSINPYNGHAACNDSFSSVNLVGGSASGATCMVDVGGDVGGTILTVQGDADFAAASASGQFGGIVTAPAEFYGLHE